MPEPDDTEYVTNIVRERTGRTIEFRPDRTRYGGFEVLCDHPSGSKGLFVGWVYEFTRSEMGGVIQAIIRRIDWLGINTGPHFWSTALVNRNWQTIHSTWSTRDR